MNSIYEHIHKTFTYSNIFRPLFHKIHFAAKHYWYHWHYYHAEQTWINMQLYLPGDVLLYYCKQSDTQERLQRLVFSSQIEAKYFLLMSNGTNGEHGRRSVYCRDCIHLHFSFHIILFHMIGQLRLFIQWNFNWEKNRKETERHRRLQSKPWQHECSIFVSLFNFWISHIAWILLGIYAPCYSDDRTSIVYAYLTRLSVSCRWELFQIDRLRRGVAD